MAWTVPEKGEEKTDKREVETREMRVKRYKEKRHNRLFAKRIRYQVRKLNAEKRPRLKVPSRCLSLRYILLLTPVGRAIEPFDRIKIVHDLS